MIDKDWGDASMGQCIRWCFNKELSNATMVENGWHIGKFQGWSAARYNLYTVENNFSNKYGRWNSQVEVQNMWLNQF